MKKVILLFVVALTSQLAFTQELVKLDFSDFENTQLMKTNNLENFKYLATKAEVGVAYLEENKIKTYNTENGIKLIRVTSNAIEGLNKSLNFSSSVEMIIIDILKPNFNIKSIDCSNLKQFGNLKYIYFRYQIDIKNNSELQKFDCLPVNVKQYYTKQLAS
ncbi:hypothetical protein KO494_11175 [Lacinutrix sp. C3R15]|uniref:hypothetical protein n=1 Tax=Flavobacteriaceae TaxID=49546 RepID=UPI001C088B28|nr:MULTISPECIES: hypothetical protein [Flavobacteriaceae]MBU2940100.1 hypothetical protein [Lacinutrix sp. C3R15]MDO6623417.1 hypothetical protein [Oceanihabitans sp. 1_MG-2023]